MRLLLVNQYFWPDMAATAQLLSDLAEDLASRGWSVQVITGRASYVAPKNHPPWAPQETWKEIEIHRVWSTRFGRSSSAGRLMDYATFLLSAATKVVTETRCDVVVCLSTPPFIALVGLLAQWRGCKLVYKVEDLYPDIAVALGKMRPGTLAHRVFHRLSLLLLSRADRVVALDRAMAGTLEARGARRVDVIPNWSDGDAIRPEPRAGQEMRRMMGWGDSFVVLYSGNMGLAHRFDAVLDAARNMQESGFDMLFAFVGGGVRREEIVQASERLANVQVYGYRRREELNDLYNAADLHLVTLRNGVMGLLVPSKYAAALAAGKPVLVVGGVGSDLHEEVRQLGLGWVCAHRSSEVTAALHDAMNDPASLQAMGQRAREAFRARYSRAEATCRWARLLAETAQGS